MLNLLPGSGQIGPGKLDARAWPVEAHYFPEVDLLEPLRVNYNTEVLGQSWMYTVKNQFVEVTNKWDSSTTYFYYHPIPSGVTEVSILNAKHEPVSVPFLIEGGRLFHVLDGAIYWVKYFANDRFYEEMMTYVPVVPRAARRMSGDPPFVPSDSFGWTHGVIDVPSWDEHRIRFYEDNRYRLLMPYTTLPNDPWYVRVRFNAEPMPPEWARMSFSPFRPHMIATWVPGTLLIDNKGEQIIEFERKLVFDKDFNLSTP